MQTAFIECYAGASGDMFLGAWLDLGISRETWLGMLEKLSVDGYHIHVQPVYKQGIRATKVDVHLHDGHAYDEHVHDGHAHDGHAHDGHAHDGHAHDEHVHDEHVHDEHVHDGHVHDGHAPHRHLADIERILNTSELPQPVLANSLKAFRLLAEAEGKVHGISPEEVHFHEVGAVDAIVDIVGCMIGWYLAGMPECFVSRIEVGTGTVLCEHGDMPVPAPATAELMRGFVTYNGRIRGETLTPTGAAIIRTLCRTGERPPLIVRQSGYGAGSKDFQVANVLRIQLGDVEPEADRHRSSGPVYTAEADELALLLEANIDDMTPEMLAYALDRVREAGAMDAWLAPIVMKKGRPGSQISILCRPELRQTCLNILFTETTTIGVRCQTVERWILDRRLETVDTEFGRVRLKIASQSGRVVNIAPEFEDCRALAEASGAPLKEIYQAALHAGREIWAKPMVAGDD